MEIHVIVLAVMVVHGGRTEKAVHSMDSGLIIISYATCLPQQIGRFLVQSKKKILLFLHNLG